VQRFGDAWGQLLDFMPPGLEYIYNNNFIAKQETLTGCANYNK
jgi:hypothetical protein